MRIDLALRQLAELMSSEVDVHRAGQRTFKD